MTDFKYEDDGDEPHQEDLNEDYDDNSEEERQKERRAKKNKQFEDNYKLLMKEQEQPIDDKNVKVEPPKKQLKKEPKKDEPKKPPLAPPENKYNGVRYSAKPNSSISISNSRAS